MVACMRQHRIASMASTPSSPNGAPSAVATLPVLPPSSVDDDKPLDASEAAAEVAALRTELKCTAADLLPSPVVEKKDSKIIGADGLPIWVHQPNWYTTMRLGLSMHHPSSIM
jgi:hypothetical protein